MEAVVGLMRKARTGERAAFDDLFDTLYPKVYSFVARRVGDRACTEAIVKEIFFDLIGSLPRLGADEDVLLHAFQLTKRRVVLEAQVSGEARRAS